MGTEIVNEKNYTEFVKCSAKTKELLMNDCVALFLENHPEMRGTTVTQGHIMRQIVEHYLYG